MTKSFFYVTGRILNRFSKDIGAIDDFLPMATIEAIQIFLVMFGIIGMVVYVTPLMILPTIFLGVLFYYLRNMYLASSQDVKRIEGISNYIFYFSYSRSLINN